MSYLGKMNQPLTILFCTENRSGWRTFVRSIRGDKREYKNTVDEDGWNTYAPEVHVPPWRLLVTSFVTEAFKLSKRLGEERRLRCVRVQFTKGREEVTNTFTNQRSHGARRHLTTPSRPFRRRLSLDKRAPGTGGGVDVWTGGCY